MTVNIYPTYYELGKSAAVLARKALIRAYEETGSQVVQNHQEDGQESIMG